MSIGSDLPLSRAASDRSGAPAHDGALKLSEGDRSGWIASLYCILAV